MYWRLRIGRPHYAALSIAAVLAAGAATSEASQISIAPLVGGGNAVLYEAAPGEANNISVIGEGPATLHLWDATSPSPVVITPLDPCSTAPLNVSEAFCPITGVEVMLVQLGDMNDWFSAGTYGGLPVEVYGEGDADTIYGSVQDDLLFGDQGNDTVSGAHGNDLIDGGPGADRMFGSYEFSPVANEADGVDYSTRTAPITATLDGLANDGEASEGDRIGTDVEDVFGGTAADTITGDAQPNQLWGLGGEDSLDGGSGPDVLDGGDGADSLTGGPGEDKLVAGPGDDTIAARDDSTDQITCGSGQDRVVADSVDQAAEDCELVERPAQPVTSTPTPSASTPTPTAAPVDRAPPSVSVTLAATYRLKAAIARGLRAKIGCSEACSIRITAGVARSLARSLGMATAREVIVGRGSGALLSAGSTVVTLRLSTKAARALRGVRRAKISLRLTITDAAGNSAALVKHLTLVR